MLRLPTDHGERFILADEVHARPPEPMETPSRASYVALMVEAEERTREHAHLTTLCERYSVMPPPPQASHFIARLGPVRLKWERHGEFSAFAFFAGGEGTGAYDEPVLSLLPEGWLAALPGRTIMAAHAKLIGAQDQPPHSAMLAEHFDGNVVVGAEIGDGAGMAFTDFRIHADGCARFLLLDRRFTPRQAGRLVQRLFEIEAYRMMALLALPMARRQAPRILAIERSLATLTDAIAHNDARDEALLGELTHLAAEVESGLAASQYRFGASVAYADLVRTRIAELREHRIASMQTIEEFMARRLTPAMATCASLSQRMRDVAQRIARASALLSTRVDIARQRQNQALLASMERRAGLQLRLQQTVEGLSVAAITYYVVGLIAYLAKALSGAGMRIESDIATGLSIPVVVLLVAYGLRRVHSRIITEDNR
jgi:uncharacterized membrane-anchored protein